jgi:hypothetical protein
MVLFCGFRTIPVSQTLSCGVFIGSQLVFSWLQMSRTTRTMEVGYLTFQIGYTKAALLAVTVKEQVHGTHFLFEVSIVMLLVELEK